MTIRVYKSCFQTPFEKISIISIHINISVNVPSIYRYVKCPTNDSSSARYLGVDVSSTLSWNSHIDRVVNNANRTLGYIRRNIKCQNTDVSESAYNTLVRPQLEYASAVWDPHTKERISKIEMVQRRAARWTLRNFDHQASVTEMINKLGWRTLEQRRAIINTTRN